MNHAILSIIICTRNRPQNLRQTLLSIANCDIPTGFRAELIIVDNGQPDRTEQLVRSTPVPNMHVRYLREPLAGLSHARNRGLLAARGEVILFTDDDVRVPHNWLHVMSHPILTGQSDATTGQVSIAPHLCRPWLTPAHREHLTEVTDRAAEHNKPFLIGANMAFHRRVLADIPGFEPALGAGALGYMEETLFQQQLTVAGYRIQFISGHPVEHHFDPARLTRRAQLRSARAHGRSAAWMMYHWSHDDVPNRAEQQKQNAIAKFRRSVHWLLTSRIGFDPEEITYTIRYWVCRELEALQGSPRQYAKRALRPLSAPPRIRALVA